MSESQPSTEIPFSPVDLDRRGTLLDGKAVGAHLRGEVAKECDDFLGAYGRRPGLTAVLVGDDPASEIYVASKTRSCEEAGIRGETIKLPDSTREQTLLAEIDRLNEDDAVDGILVQLPLPASISVEAVQARVEPAKDVDGFHPINVGRLWSGGPALAPATPAGILRLLQIHQVPLTGMHAVVVGRSSIVGKPMAALLLRENCTVTVCHSRTRDLAATCRSADLLISAVGRAALIGPDSVADGAIVIDVGTNRVEDPELVERLFPDNAARRRTLEKRGSVLTGDVDFEAVRPHASAITPVPGGVGPLTIAMVLVNTLECARRRVGGGGGP